MIIPRQPLARQIRRALFTLLLLLASRTILNAQGYRYTFVGSDASELDGSYIVLFNHPLDPPSLSSLSAAKILDSYGSGAVFDILAPPNSVSGFAVTLFGPAGFSGQITCEMVGYLGEPSVVILSGEPANISFSRNLFYPGNPSGGVIVGDWFVEVIPEPNTLTVILGAGLLCGRLWLRRASPDSSLPLPVIRSGKV